LVLLIFQFFTNLQQEGDQRQEWLEPDFDDQSDENVGTKAAYQVDHSRAGINIFIPTLLLVLHNVFTGWKEDIHVVWRHTGLFPHWWSLVVQWTIRLPIRGTSPKDLYRISGKEVGKRQTTPSIKNQLK